MEEHICIDCGDDNCDCGNNDEDCTGCKLCVEEREDGSDGVEEEDEDDDFEDEDEDEDDGFEAE
jgi:hypothetical protein